MCFKNLPIEFDAGGKAKLKDGVANPYSVTMAEPKGYVRRQEGPGAPLAAPPRRRAWNIHPIRTRRRSPSTITPEKRGPAAITENRGRKTP